MPPRRGRLGINHWLKSMGKPPLMYDIIMEAYREDYGDLWGVFAHPASPRKRGIGKSVFAIKMLMLVYRDWNIAKRYIFYSPVEFIRVFERLVDRQERIPLAVWDDAGAWLFRGRFKNKFVMAVVEHLEVIRSHIGTMMFTATSYGKLAKGIRESLGFIVLISTEGEAYSAGRKWKKARARLYLNNSEDMSWLFNRRAMPEPIAEWIFTVRLPDEIYKEYKEMRDSYVRAGLEKLKEELKDLAEKAAEELTEVAGKAEKKPEAQDPEEPESIEELAEEWGYI